MNGEDVIDVVDTFDDDQRRGAVIGSTAGGRLRQGSDRHRVLSIDRGRLRIASLPEPGWGSTALSYELTAVQHGTAFAALVLNGHNTSQSEPLGETLGRRFKRWLKGNEVEPWYVHVGRWMLRGRRAWTLRLFRHWLIVDRRTRLGTILKLDENLSVGLLPAPTSRDPLAQGNSFVMHATGAKNGELWVSDRGQPRRVLPSVHNVPLYLLVVVRDDTVVHLAASIDDVAGLPALPSVRPLAIVPRDVADRAFGSIQQAASGQIGFAVDSRVHTVAAGIIDEWLTGRAAPVVDSDLRTLAPGEVFRSRADAPIGLIRVTAAAASTFDVSWGNEAGRQRRLRVTESQFELTGMSDGSGDLAARTERTPDTRPIDLQITDDGHSIGVYLGGALMFNDWIRACVRSDGKQLRVRLHSGSAHAVEAHAMSILLPDHFRPAPLPVPITGSRRFVAADEFGGPEQDLDGRVGPWGEPWRHTVGHGRIISDGHGARVDATARDPLPGRSTYTVPCPIAGAVELEIDVLPPGDGRGDGHRGRAGVVFEQDRGNALIVSTWLDDSYDGGSISSFFHLDGFEDLYDAVWTNVGTRIVHGRPYRLRVAFDGMVYSAWVDDELVLYRGLDDVNPSQNSLEINRVGIVANWEWGTDTGSVFRKFTVRAPER